MFTFGVPGYNVRSTELNAVLGLEQIQRLDYNIEKRQENFRLWVSLLNDDKYYTDYLEKGSSNFALPLIIKDGNEILLEKVCTLLNNERVEYRLGMAGGGNQALPPYIRDYPFFSFDLKNIQYAHNFGLYLGNHPELTIEQISDLCKELNSL